LTKYLSSLTLTKTSSLLQNHASNAFNLLISSCNDVHVSHPYNTTSQTSTFTILFFNLLLNPFVKNSFLLLNVSFAIAIVTFTSLWLLPSSVITDPKYLKLLTCSILSPSTVMLTTPPPSQRTTVVFVFLTLIFMPKFLAVSFNLFINLCNPISVPATIP